MKHFFTFGGFDSRDLNLCITGIDRSGTPEREVSKISVLGRSGDLLIDSGRYKNIEITYHVAILSDFNRAFQTMKTAMLSQIGYHRLTDSFNPDEFVIGAFAGTISPELVRRGQTGTFDLVFDCKPQRYIIDGTHAIQMQNPSSLVNGTGFPALPLITVHGSGSGSITVGNTRVEIHKLQGSLILDCDLQNAYTIGAGGALENKNADITAPVFPVLSSGTNEIGWSGGITGIEIIPRWWTI